MWEFLRKFDIDSLYMYICPPYIWRNATLPAVRCKSFTFYKVVWWHFSDVVGKGVTVCFFLRNINNLKYVWIILLKMTFWMSQGKVATYTGKVGKCTSYRCQIFSGFNTPKSLKSVNFWQSYLKNIKGAVFVDTVYTRSRPYGCDRSWAGLWGIIWEGGFSAGGDARERNMRILVQDCNLYVSK